MRATIPPTTPPAMAPPEVKSVALGEYVGVTDTLGGAPRVKPGPCSESGKSIKRKKTGEVMLTTDGMRFAGVPRVLCVLITVTLKKSVLVG